MFTRQKAKRLNGRMKASWIAGTLLLLLGSNAEAQQISSCPFVHDPNKLLVAAYSHTLTKQSLLEMKRLDIDAVIPWEAPYAGRTWNDQLSHYMSYARAASDIGMSVIQSLPIGASSVKSNQFWAIQQAFAKYIVPLDAELALRGRPSPFLYFALPDEYQLHGFSKEDIRKLADVYAGADPLQRPLFLNFLPNSGDIDPANAFELASFDNYSWFDAWLPDFRHFRDLARRAKRRFGAVLPITASIEQLRAQIYFAVQNGASYISFFQYGDADRESKQRLRTVLNELCYKRSALEQGAITGGASVSPGSAVTVRTYKKPELDVNGRTVYFVVAVKSGGPASNPVYRLPAELAQPVNAYALRYPRRGAVAVNSDGTFRDRSPMPEGAVARVFRFEY